MIKTVGFEPPFAENNNTHAVNEEVGFCSKKIIFMEYKHAALIVQILKRDT